MPDRPTIDLGPGHHDGTAAAPRSPFAIDSVTAFYTVGQVATMLGIQPAFLRRLDAEQVVRPARSPGGQRRYSRTEIGQLERVNELVTEGLNLAGVRRIMQLEAEISELRREIEAERARRSRR